MVKIEQVKHWAWRLAIMLLVLLYLNMSLYVGSCALFHIEWDDNLWGEIASGGDLLGWLAVLVGYPVAYRLRKRRWLCLLLVALPVILMLPMALELGWTPDWWR